MDAYWYKNDLTPHDHEDWLMIIDWLLFVVYRSLKGCIYSYNERPNEYSLKSIFINSYKILLLALGRCWWLQQDFSCHAPPCLWIVAVLQDSVSFHLFDDCIQSFLTSIYWSFHFSHFQKCPFFLLNGEFICTLWFFMNLF